jgi:hypothetical protein
MRPTAASLGTMSALPPAALAVAALALAAAVAASLPLVDLLPCMKFWQHGVAACLR